MHPSGNCREGAGKVKEKAYRCRWWGKANLRGLDINGGKKLGVHHAYVQHAKIANPLPDMNYSRDTRIPHRAIVHPTVIYFKQNDSHVRKAVDFVICVYDVDKKYFDKVQEIDHDVD